MTRIAWKWTDEPGGAEIWRAVTGAGHHIYAVGGAVRDAVLLRPIGDIDLATDARPEAVTKAARAAGLRVVPTGVDHGTVTVVAERPYEITTFRKDIETDGRRARVVFTDRLEEDAARRDLTMNALYSDELGKVWDPVGGLNDLKSGRVRFIGDAGERIREDFLRSLRYFRFLAHYGKNRSLRDSEDIAAISANLDGLDTISAERIGAEFKKLFSAERPAFSVRLMEKAGVLDRLLPGATADAIDRLDSVEARENIPPWSLRRLAALRVAGLKQGLRLSNAEDREVNAISNALEADEELAVLAYRFGQDAARDAALIRAAESGKLLAADWKKEIKRGGQADFPIKASDLTPLSGVELGEKLRALESRWLASGMQASKEDLLKAAG